MQNRTTLAGLNATLALLAFVLPEREAHPTLYAHTQNLLDLLDRTDLWPLAYLRWETALLDDLGYGLDLKCCAVTGSTDGLVYVSPKSGRAVSAQGAGEWADRLLPLPAALRDGGATETADIADALGLTGYFLEHKLAADQVGKPLPEARARYIDILNRAVSRPTSAY
jgi:DNA repair protein RecO (recombination protein O)